MMKTLKGNNGSSMAVGNLQIQPVVSDVSYTVKQQSTSISSPISPAVLPASQALINSTVMIHESGNLQVIKAPTLSQIATSMSSNSKFLMPSLAGNSPLVPTYAIKLSPVLMFNQALLDNLTVTTKKFEPYEALTGVSHDRPEVLMLTEFLPIFDRSSGNSAAGAQFIGANSYMTDAGKLIDTQIQLRNLRFSNVSNMLKTLKDRFPTLAMRMSTRSRTFQSQMSTLQEASDFLLNLIRHVDRLKQQLDLRDAVHVVEPQAIARDHLLNFTRASSVATSHSVLDMANRYLPASYDIPDILVRLGYTHENVKHNFSSTKVWLQLLLELRNMIRAHSLEFLDIQPVQQEIDNNSAVLTKSNAVLFNFPPIANGLLNVKELISLNAKDVTSTAFNIGQAYEAAYEGVGFKTDESRIAALAHTISREYRFSWGLSRPDVVKTLNDYYSYAVAPIGNVDVLDAVFGRFGNNISDIPATVTNDLASLGQQQPATNVALLTFESKYLEGDTGTLTPGSAYYIDNMMQTTDGKSFDTSRLSDLATTLDTANKQLNVIVNGMSMLSVHVSSPNDQSLKNYEAILANPSDLTTSLLSRLLSGNAAPLPVVTDDRLTSVFAAAATNNNLKSLLLMLTLARMTRTYSVNIPNFSTSQDNTALVDAIIEQIISQLTATAKQTSTGVFFVKNKLFSSSTKTETLTQNSIRSALKQGTPLTSYIETSMSKSFATFLKNAIGKNERTRYTGCLDTTVMMFMFDMITQMVSKYGNQQIVGAQPGTTPATKNSFTFTVAKPTVNYRNSVKDLNNRISREMAFVQQGLYAVMNSLKNLSGSIRGFVNYLSAPSTLFRLNSISNIINDPTLFHLLLSKQQALALSATVSDLLDMINNFNVSSSEMTAAGAAAQMDSDIRSLDDSVVSPPIRDALYGMLSDEAYASTLGFNKKILTVGIPLGFTQRMKQVVNISKLKKSSFVNKQEDIVKVVVYKVDLENSDIIYKPLSFLFEMSRFPVRNSNAFLSVPGNPTIEDIVAAIPTRDLSQNSSDAANTINYMMSKDADVSKMHSVAFNDPSYDFLNSRQKFEILHNHVTSYLLEVYVKLMTGLNIADNQFNIVEPPNPVGQDFVKLIIQHQLSHVVDNVSRVNTSQTQHPPVGGVLFRTTAPTASPPSTGKMGMLGKARAFGNSSGRSGNVDDTKQFSDTPVADAPTQTSQEQDAVPNIDVSMGRLSQRHAAQVLHDLRMISNASRMVMPISDPDAVSQQMIKPKQFDRVFNVIIDPDDFEIDYNKTVSTPQGKQALTQMINRGDVEATTPGQIMQGTNAAMNFGLAQPRNFIQGRIEPNVNQYNFRSRDKNEGDLTFEKYIVTIESLDEEEV